MNLLKAASTVSLMTLASRITGLLREILVASHFGAGAAADAFNVAFRIPNLLRRLFAEGAFSQAFVPLLAHHRAQEGDEATRAWVNAVATVMVWVLVGVSLLGVLAAPVLVYAMAAGLQAFDTAVVLTRIMFPYIAFMSLAALSAGILNTWRHFLVPAATPVLLNLSVIGAAVGLTPLLEARGVPGIYALAVGVMVGGVLQLAVQLPALSRVAFLPQVAWRVRGLKAAWQHPGVRQVLGNMAPAVLGVSVAQVSLLINTQIASLVGVGAVSWLSYADRLMEFPTALLGVALGVVLIPQLSAALGRGDTRRYSDLLDWGLRLVLLLALPSAMALLIMPEPLVALLYHRGAFLASDVAQTVLALRAYGVGLLGLVAIKILAPGYYAQQNLRTPVRIAIGVLVLTQLLNTVLVPRLGHAGLALSISVGAWVNALFLLGGLLHQGRFQLAPGWGAFLLKVGVANAVVAAWMGGFVGLQDWVGPATRGALRALWVLGGVCGAAALYLGLLWLMGLRLKAFLRRA